MNDNKRVAGTIGSVFYGKEDHGILTMYLGIDFEGYHQSFGGIRLDETIGPDFVKSVCDTFGVSDPERLKGLPCYGLYAFGEHNETICGLEASNGKRFIVNSWCRKHYPETKSVLEQKGISLLSDIKHYERRAQEARVKLVKLEELYTEWEGT